MIGAEITVEDILALGKELNLTAFVIDGKLNWMQNEITSYSFESDEIILRLVPERIYGGTCVVIKKSDLIPIDGKQAFIECLTDNAKKQYKENKENEYFGSAKMIMYFET